MSIAGPVDVSGEKFSGAGRGAGDAREMPADRMRMRQSGYGETSVTLLGSRPWMPIQALSKRKRVWGLPHIPVASTRKAVGGCHNDRYCEISEILALFGGEEAGGHAASGHGAASGYPGAPGAQRHGGGWRRAARESGS